MLRLGARSCCSCRTPPHAAVAETVRLAAAGSRARCRCSTPCCASSRRRSRALLEGQDAPGSTRPNGCGTAGRPPTARSGRGRSPRPIWSSRRSISRWCGTTPSAGPSELRGRDPADRHAAPAQRRVGRGAARFRRGRLVGAGRGGGPAGPADGRARGKRVPTCARHLAARRRSCAPRARGHRARAVAQRGSSSWSRNLGRLASPRRSSSPTCWNGSRRSRSTPCCSTRPVPPPGPSAGTRTFRGQVARRRAAAGRGPGQAAGGAVALTRPGGVLVYAVCSLQPEEGEQRIEAVAGGRRAGTRADPAHRAARSPGPHRRAGRGRTLPCDLADLGGLDGFFVARLRRVAA